MRRCLMLLGGLILAGGFLADRSEGAWQPSKPVEFVVPAGTGGGADVMARFIASIVEKEHLSPKPFIVVNRPGGAGAEGFIYVKGKPRDAHTLIITLSNLFTTPLATGVPFTWKDLTPLARLALDEFILWVPADAPYKSVADYLKAVHRNPKQFKMGGTGTAQEDQLITLQIEQAAKVTFTYVPFKGGGEVAANLVGKQVDSTVNNPAEAAGHWKAGRVRPLAVFDTERLPMPPWKDIPTMKEAGYDITYLMLRGIFGPPGMPRAAQEYYIDLLKKVYEAPDFQKYLSENALKPAWLTGQDYVRWLEEAEKLHRELMQKGGLIK